LAFLLSDAEIAPIPSSNFTQVNAQAVLHQADYLPLERQGESYEAGSKAGPMPCPITILVHLPDLLDYRQVYHYSRHYQALMPWSKKGLLGTIIFYHKCDAYPAFNAITFERLP
jgi:hypothetical protein